MSRRRWGKHTKTTLSEQEGKANIDGDDNLHYKFNNDADDTGRALPSAGDSSLDCAGPLDNDDCALLLPADDVIAGAASTAGAGPLFVAGIELSFAAGEVPSDGIAGSVADYELWSGSCDGGGSSEDAEDGHDGREDEWSTHIDCWLWWCEEEEEDIKVRVVVVVVSGSSEW